MSQKQDRINEVLAERITQLENELRAAQNGKERAENETRLVKDEAYEVVGQWSAENAGLRRKLAKSDETCAISQAALKNRDETVACLKEELAISHQLCAEYSSAIEELHKQNAELASKNEELEKSLSAANASINTSNQQIKDFERLVSKFEAELKELVAARKIDGDVIDDLRKSLAAASSENRVLRQAGEDVSSSTGKLLDRVAKLKDENDNLYRTRERLTADLKAARTEAENALKESEKQREQIRQLSSDLTAATTEVQRLKAANNDLVQKGEEMSLSLQAFEAAGTQQLEVIQNLENDLQESKDTNITAGKMIDDLQSELEYTKQQLEEAVKAKDDLGTELSTIKECYSNVLVDFDDFKHQSAKKIEEAKLELDSAQKIYTDRIALVEQNYNSAWSSVQELTGALHSHQKSEFLKKEQLERQALLLEQQTSLSLIYEQRLRAAAQFLQKAHSNITTAEARISQLEQSAKKDTEQLTIVTNRYHTCEQTLSEQRKGFSILEAQLSQSNARLKEAAAERDVFATDNEWLKSQVESMRQELGELDEILNSNLNEMREENERLQLENETQQQKLLSYSEKESQNADLVHKLEANAADMEKELRAQTKTLEITEAELQATKARVESVSTSLQVMQKRAEELDVLNAELLKTTAALASQVAELQERVGSQDAKLSLILSDKRKESELVKTKLNAYVEKYEKAEQLLRAEGEAKKAAESAAASAKEQNAKLRAAVDELKTRCASDATSLNNLIAERDDLMRDRDIIVEKYNKLHDAFRNVRKEAHSKVADELRRVMELAVSQEAELQTLRQQNVTLKKSVSMFVESAQPKAEAIFMERLNLTEGPLRHPKKRSAANAGE